MSKEANDYALTSQVFQELTSRAEDLLYAAERDAFIAGQTTGAVSLVAALGAENLLMQKALEFYAGRSADGHWTGNKFFCIGKFGEVVEEACGPLVARQTLDALKKKD